MSLIFRVLCALFEQIPFGKNRDILKKNPTLCGAKNSNKLRVPGHLVTWIPHTDNIRFTTTWIRIRISALERLLGDGVLKGNRNILSAWGGFDSKIVLPL